MKIQTEATEWGCEHQKYAVEKYASFMRENHLNFVVRDSGSYISIKKPFQELARILLFNENVVMRAV